MTETDPPQDQLGASNWEQRQRQASFYQTQLASVQQAAISAQTSTALMITRGATMAKFSGVTSGQDWMVLSLAILGWLIMALMLTASFSRSALRIKRAYLREQSALFTGSAAYELESFLLDFRRRRDIERGG